MTSPPTIVAALASVMADVTHVAKSDRNDFHKFMYRGIDSVLDAVGPALRTYGVVVTPKCVDLQSRDVPTKAGVAREITLLVEYVFHGPAGDSITVTVPGEAQDSGDKAVSKAMAVAYRTALIQTLSIPVNERDPHGGPVDDRADPVRAAKDRIMAEARRREWDVPALAANFADWSDGGDLREAGLDQLDAYYAHLVPPKTMQRSTSRATDRTTKRATSRQPAAPAPVDEPPLDEPAVDPAERDAKARRALHAAYGQLGIDRDARLAHLSQVTGRRIETSKDVTGAEVSRALDELHEMIRAEREDVEP